MAASAWKGSLTFGLVSIPLKLYPAARTRRIELHQLHKPCGTRLRRPLFCPSCNRMVEREEVVKGYEYEKGQYLVVEDQEIKKILPESGGTMEIQEFVPLAEIDPLYYDASYFAVPEKAGQKAYRLLVETMEAMGQVAVAKLVMHQREYVVAIRTRDRGLTLHTLYFADEIHAVSDYGHLQGEVKPQEVELAKQLVSSLSAHFDITKYHDDYQRKLQELLDAKLKGERIPAAPERKLAPVVDMMQALKDSLAQQRPQRAAAKTERAAHGKTRRRAS